MRLRRYAALAEKADGSLYAQLNPLLFDDLSEDIKQQHRAIPGRTGRFGMDGGDPVAAQTVFFFGLWRLLR